MGMCRTVPDRTSSYMLMCDGPNSANYTYFTSEDCSGDPTSTISMKEFFDEYYYEADYNITCCTQNLCRYAKRIEYATSNCGQNTTGVFRAEYLSIIGGCDTSYGPGDNSASTAYPVCENGQLTEVIYDGNTDCSGSPTSVRVISDDDCNQWGKQTDIECNIAIDTCSFTGIGYLKFCLFLL